LLEVTPVLGLYGLGGFFEKITVGISRSETLGSPAVLLDNTELESFCWDFSRPLLLRRFKIPE
jgi:hypothetical protein